MRIYLRLSKNDRTVPFNYQELLTGAIHKWIGENNEIHGKSDQYSFSWIQNTKAVKNGIELKKDAYFFIASPNEVLVKRIVSGILDDPGIFNNVNVFDLQIQNTPNFSTSERFLMGSPVLLKVKEGDKVRHVTLEDDDFEELLTKNMKRKLDKGGLVSEGFHLRLDPESNFRQTKLVTYKGIKNRTSFAPIIINGTQEQIEFAWSVGLGNSTGIGFGALK